MFSRTLNISLSSVVAFSKNGRIISSLFREEISACAEVHTCYDIVRLRAIHNSFASFGGDIIRACRANKTECQGTPSHRTGVNFPFSRGKRIQYLSVST